MTRWSGYAHTVRQGPGCEGTYLVCPLSTTVYLPGASTQQPTSHPHGQINAHRTSYMTSCPSLWSLVTGWFKGLQSISAFQIYSSLWTMGDQIRPSPRARRGNNRRDHGLHAAVVPVVPTRRQSSRYTHSRQTASSLPSARWSRPPMSRVHRLVHSCRCPIMAGLGLLDGRPSHLTGKDKNNLDPTSCSLPFPCLCLTTSNTLPPSLCPYLTRLASLEKSRSSSSDHTLLYSCLIFPIASRPLCPLRPP